MNLRCSFLFGLGFALLGLCGCGGSGSSSGGTSTLSQVRALNDFADVSRVSAKAGGTNLLINQPFATVSQHVNVTPGSKPITFLDAGSGATLATLQVSLVGQITYNAVGLGSQAKGRHILLLTDDRSTVPTQTKVRFINGDEDAPALDVYVTPPGTTDLTGRTPQRANIAFADETVPYDTISPGSYRVWYTPPGQPGTLTVGADETFTANQNITLLVLKGPSGLTVQIIPDA